MTLKREICCGNRVLVKAISGVSNLFLRNFRHKKLPLLKPYATNMSFFTGLHPVSVSNHLGDPLVPRLESVATFSRVESVATFSMVD